MSTSRPENRTEPRGIDRRGPFLFSLLVAALLALSPSVAGAGPALAQDAPPPATAGDEPGPPKQTVAVVPVAGDTEIAGRLQRILDSTGWFEAPRVSVRDGVVFLDGSTATAEHRRWAGTLAENTEGTVAVVNRIEVEADVRSTFERAGQSVAEMARQIVQAWPLVALALVIVLATGLLAKLAAIAARRFFAGRVASPLLLSILVRALSIPILLLGVYFVLQVAGLTGLAVTVLGGTGLVGIIIGFAFRDIAENFLASLLLSIRNPFRSGDLIAVAGYTGVVQNLNTRSTVLLTLDGNHVQIPNAMVFKSVIENYSSIPSRRADFGVGIGYDSPVAKAQAMIAAILKTHPAVLDEPEPLVLVEALGAATIDIRVSYWFDSTVYSPAKINSALLRLTKNALLEGGIELPDPAREVVFPKGVPIVRAEGGLWQPAPRKAEAAPATATQAGADETSAATTGEGDLTSEQAAIRQQDGGTVPEATENLLDAGRPAAGDRGR